MAKVEKTLIKKLLKLYKQVFGPECQYHGFDVDPGEPCKVFAFRSIGTDDVADFPNPALAKLIAASLNLAFRIAQQRHGEFAE